jgi:hypothetical protein
MELAFSQPSGSPASAEGNFIIRIRILEPISISRSIVLEKRGALRGVVIMVAFTPCLAKVLAMSTVGMIWPWAMNGKNAM